MPTCGGRHGKITKYEYEYWPRFKAEFIERINTSAKEVLLNNLADNTTYRFRMRAYTKEGPGPFSATYDASAGGPLAGKC